MRRFVAGAILIPGVVAALGVLVLVLWVRGASLSDLQLRVAQGPGGASIDAVDGVAAGGRLIAGTGKPPINHDHPQQTAGDLSGEWPGFRGSNRDNIAPPGDAGPGGQLARAWPSGGPKVLWSVPLGEGYAGAGRSGRPRLPPGLRRRRRPATPCDASRSRAARKSGAIPTPSRSNGITACRAPCPPIAGSYVVAMGPKCHVTCLDATTGQLRWQINLVRQYGTKVPGLVRGPVPAGGRRAGSSWPPAGRTTCSWRWT